MNELDPARPLIVTPRSAEANASPDWTTHSEEIFCPLCGYNLRGLTDARCPECGYSFVWSQLLDPANRKHPYLFEHHPEKNIRSFFKTAIGGLRPKRFWTSLTPVQTFFPVRLLIYWFIAAAIGGLTLLAASTYELVSEAIANPPHQRRFYGLAPWNPAFRYGPSFDDFLYQWHRSGALYEVGLLLLWPWITFLALMIFQISMRRAGIRKMHVLRTVLYSGDFVFWAGLAAPLAAGALLGAQVLFKNNPVEIPIWLYNWGFLACWLVMAHRLQVAYRRYLRFDHPMATVIASQIVAALFVLAIIFQVSF